MAAGRRIEVLLLPLGVLTSHGLGYLLAHPHGPDRNHALEHHSHLPTLAVLALAAAVAALATAAVSGRRRRPVQARLPSVALAQAAALVGLELVEHAVSGTGIGAALGETGLWWALAVQLLVAWATLLLLRAGVAMGAAVWPARAVSAGLGPSRLTSHLRQAVDRRPPAWPASRRGPPQPAPA